MASSTCPRPANARPRLMWASTSSGLISRAAGNGRWPRRPVLGAARAMPRSWCTWHPRAPSRPRCESARRPRPARPNCSRQRAEVAMQAPVVRRLGECRLVGLPSRLLGFRRRCQSAKVVPALTCRRQAEAVVELIGEWFSATSCPPSRRPTGTRPTESAPAIPRIAAARGSLRLPSRAVAASCGKAAQTWSKTARASK